MSNGSNETGQVLGAATTTLAGAAGVAVLPNTAGSTLLQFMSIAAIILGSALLITAVVRKYAKHVN
ncbi:hypothetical protein DYH10_02845 [Candidatus Saccharibacteria bacterium CPR2]|nr:hypothetical protein [Candidatus Saccharibacteria bacterium CPR2]